MNPRGALPLLAFSALLLTASSAGACPACIANGLPTRTANAYLAVTALLSLTPLLFFAYFWVLLRSQSKGDGDR